MIIITINDSTADSLPAFATHHMPLFCFVYLTPVQQGKRLLLQLRFWSSSRQLHNAPSPDEQILELIAEATLLLSVIIRDMPFSPSSFICFLRLDLLFSSSTLFRRLVSKSCRHDTT